MAENNAPEAAPAKKGKLKLILLLVVVIVLAIALSVAGTFWFLGASLPGLDNGEGATEEAAEEVFVASTYLEMDKALVTTVQADGRQRYAQAFLALEAKSPEALAAAELHMPLIRSQLVLLLGSRPFQALRTPEGRRELAQSMLETVNEVLAQENAPAIERVLFRNFVVQ